jgi:hypothetical protein
MNPADIDQDGQQALISAARDAGAWHFTLVSIPRQPVRESSLTRAKAAAEQSLKASGMPWTILAANFFMEVWLSPAVGFDWPNRRAVIFGEGRGLITWVSVYDVAEIAVRAHLSVGWKSWRSLRRSRIQNFRSSLCQRRRCWLNSNRPATRNRKPSRSYSLNMFTVASRTLRRRCA